MKGLLMKDLLLLKNQKSFFVILLVFAFFFGKDNPIAGVSYLTFISAMVVGNSMSYDEYDNGYAFLMTLPFKRQTYIQSKYLLSFLCVGVTWLASMIVAIIAQLQITPEENWIEMVEMGSLILLVALVFAAVMILMRLKYGQNKASLSFVIMSGTIAVIGYLIYKCIEIFRIDITPMIQMLNSLNLLSVVAVGILIVGIVLGISYSVSCRVMNQKEF